MGLSLGRLLIHAEDPISHRANKRHKTSSSSGGPQGARDGLNLTTLPDHAALDGIVSFLCPNDVLHLSESSWALMETHRFLTRKIVVHDDKSSSSTSSLVWMLGRLPNLRQLTVKGSKAGMGMLKALRKGYGREIQHVEMMHEDPGTFFYQFLGYIPVLIALSNGGCPQLKTLTLVVVGKATMTATIPLINLAYCLRCRRNRHCPDLLVSLRFETTEPSTTISYFNPCIIERLRGEQTIANKPASSSQAIPVIV